MSHLDPEALAQMDAPLLSPAPVIYAGLGTTALGWIASMTKVAVSPTVTAVLVVVGLLCVGVGLALHLSRARSEVENAFTTAAWWLLAAAATFVGSFALEESADSMSALLKLFTLVAVVAALLSAVPRTYRLVGISLLIAWHFFAIFTATQIIGGTAGPSWLASQVWTRVTRPYLQITHLNNGYHFYAPEPGPVALVWIRVRFADGAVVWERLPNHEKCRNHIERRRMAAIASMMGQSMPGQPTEEQIRQRDEAGPRYDPAIPSRPQGLDLGLQFRAPEPLTKMVIESVARYFARTTAHPKGERVPVASVKIYRGECSHPPVEHFHAGRDPLDPTLYRAWYLGEYDPDGNLVEASTRDMLYWQIPIFRSGDDAPPAGPFDKNRPGAVQEPWGRGGKIMNFLRIHAGDGNKEDMP